MASVHELLKFADAAEVGARDGETALDAFLSACDDGGQRLAELVVIAVMAPRIRAAAVKHDYAQLRARAARALERAEQRVVPFNQLRGEYGGDDVETTAHYDWAHEAGHWSVGDSDLAPWIADCARCGEPLHADQSRCLRCNTERPL